VRSLCPSLFVQQIRLLTRGGFHISDFGYTNIYFHSTPIYKYKPLIPGDEI